MQCAHTSCTCEVDDRLTHCGPACRMGLQGDTSEDRCKCGHADCDATIGQS